ncbi:MAG: hypothetical protein JWO80_5633 [Bryobacterales bacterium]|nr:hypothetical protein [Bryobacterales bacterium]
MTGDKAFFDTSVLVYVHDRADPRKQETAERLFRSHLASRSLYLSTQILQEFFVTLSCKVADVSADDAYALTSELAKLHVVTVTPAEVLEAIATQRRYTLSFWDSLVLVSARNSGAVVLYSEDFTHGQMFGTVRAENPFQSVSES